MPNTVEKLQEKAEKIIKSKDNMLTKIPELQDCFKELMQHSDTGFKAIVKILQDQKKCPASMHKWIVFQYKLLEENKKSNISIHYSEELMNILGIGNNDMANYVLKHREPDLDNKEKLKIYWMYKAGASVDKHLDKVNESANKCQNALLSIAKKEKESTEILKQQIINLIQLSYQGIIALKEVLKDPNCTLELRKWAILQCKLSENNVNVEAKSEYAAFNLPDSVLLMSDYKITSKDMREFTSQQPDFQNDAKLMQVFNAFDAQAIQEEEAEWSKEAKQLSKTLRELKKEITTPPETTKKDFSKEFYDHALKIVQTHTGTSLAEKAMLSSLNRISMLVRQFNAADPFAPSGVSVFKNIVSQSKNLDKYLGSEELPFDCSKLIKCISQKDRELFEASKVNAYSELASIAAIRQEAKGAITRAENVHAKKIKEEITNLSQYSEEGYQAIIAILDDERCPKWLRKWAILQYMLSEEKEAINPSVHVEAEVKGDEAQQHLKKSEQLMQKYKDVTSNEMTGFCSVQLPSINPNMKEALTKIQNTFEERAIKETEAKWSKKAKQLSASLRDLKKLTGTEDATKERKKSFAVDFHDFALGILKENTDTYYLKSLTIVTVLIKMTNLVSLFYSTNDKAAENGALKELFAENTKLKQYLTNSDFEKLIAGKEKEVNDEAYLKQKEKEAKAISENLNGLDTQQKILNKDPINTEFLTPFIQTIKKITESAMSDELRGQVIKLTAAALRFLSATNSVAQEQARKELKTTSNQLQNKTLQVLNGKFEEIIDANATELQSLTTELRTLDQKAFAEFYSANKDNYTLAQKRVIHELADSLICICKAKNKNEFYKEIVDSLVQRRLNRMQPIPYELGGFYDIVEREHLTLKALGSSQPAEVKEPAVQLPFIQEVEQEIYETLEKLSIATQKQVKQLYNQAKAFSPTADEDSRYQAVVKMYKSCKTMQTLNDAPTTLLNCVYKHIHQELMKQLQSSKAKYSAPDEEKTPPSLEQQKTRTALKSFMTTLVALEESFKNTKKEFSIPEARTIKKLLDSLLTLSQTSDEDLPRMRTKVQNDHNIVFNHEKQSTSLRFHQQVDQFERIRGLINIVKAVSKPEVPQLTQKLDRTPSR